MSNVEKLRQRYWQLEDKIKQSINRNKITIILSFACATLFIGSVALLGYAIEQHTSKENYRIKFENKDAYTKELEQQYKNLQYKYETLKEQANLSYNYDTGNFTKNIKPDNNKALLRSLPNIYIPQRSAESYIPYSPLPTRTVYIENEQRSYPSSYNPAANSAASALNNIDVNMSLDSMFQRPYLIYPYPLD